MRHLALSAPASAGISLPRAEGGRGDVARATAAEYLPVIHAH